MCEVAPNREEIEKWLAQWPRDGDRVVLTAIGEDNDQL